MRSRRGRRAVASSIIVRTRTRCCFRLISARHSWPPFAVPATAFVLTSCRHPTIEVEGSEMNLHAMLLEREAADRPVTVGLIGAGKFGAMFLAQARLTRGLHLVA